MAAECPKVNLHALTELKNTTDDAIAPFLKSLGFKQNHTLTDVRLVLGFTACAIAGATFYHDWTAGFEKAKTLTLYAVIAYFVLNTALTWWIMWVEGGKVYVGEKDGVKITLSSSSDKYTPIYRLKITWSLPGDKSQRTAEAKNTFTNWFDTDGFFVAKPFHAFLQTSIPPLAALEKEGDKAVKAKAKGTK
ncbi:hypothetical protein RUND412_000724 [Rhizina undulata]